jgi:hypothetical protein
MLAIAAFFFMRPIYAKTTPYVKGIIPNLIMKIRGLAGKGACKSVEQEDNHEKASRRSRAGNHMGNVSLKL